MPFSYPDYVREDLAAAHAQVWEMLAQPGAWWTAEDRIAIAAEVRAAGDCDFCKERKQALSPNAQLPGNHTRASNLPEIVVDTVHRIVTDANRLSESWLRGINAGGISDEQYIELLGIVVAVISIDAFHDALGLEHQALPTPAPGAPSGYRPPGAKDNGAWVATIEPEDLSEREEEIYRGAPQMSNVIKAMSLVPDSVRMLNIESDAQYMPPFQVADPTSNGGRAITRPQIELIAGRVSALNDCFY